MPHPNTSPPLTLYVHLPWCVRKCPYCDFNSHPAPEELPETAYVNALLRDLDRDLPLVGGRSLESIYFGGGTPSLFAPDSIARLLQGIRARVPVAAEAEISLEANPGAADETRFAGYRAAGVNRLSIGIQSLDARMLSRLGRIHDPAQARSAAHAAAAAGFDNINLDLMFGLPEQTPAGALADLEGVLALHPAHVSLYQLTLEPNTPFYREPPTLPDDDALWALQQALQTRLDANGYRQYEVSAYAQTQRRSRHNLNYWQFGDYLGIGAGAHGKLSGPSGITRRWKTRHPRRYLETAGSDAGLAGQIRLNEADLVLEFAMNALRLVDGVPLELFTRHTGLPLNRLQPALEKAESADFIERKGGIIRPTPQGRRFLNFALELFMDADRPDDAGGGDYPAHTLHSGAAPIT